MKVALCAAPPLGPTTWKSVAFVVTPAAPTATWPVGPFPFGLKGALPWFGVFTIRPGIDTVGLLGEPVTLASVATPERGPPGFGFWKVLPCWEIQNGLPGVKLIPHGFLKFGSTTMLGTEPSETRFVWW